MTKSFQVQAQFGKTWVIIKSGPFYKDALNYIRKANSSTYPYRIVRVVKTVVFEESK